MPDDHQVKKLAPSPSLFRMPTSIEDGIALAHQVRRWHALQGRDASVALSAEDVARAQLEGERAQWRARKRRRR